MRIIKSIYTSYFANIDRLAGEPDLLPIGIAGKPPSGFSYPNCKFLAPSWSIWKEWHDSDNPYKDYRYSIRFTTEILEKLRPEKVLEVFTHLIISSSMPKPASPVLLCYETPDKFCHRHLVAEWLKLSFPDLEVKEYEEYKTTLG